MGAEARPQRRCPACGRTYGGEGVRCWPGAAAVVTEDGKGITAHCQERGRLAVPPAMPDDVRRVVRDLRAAGAGWEVVDAWLRRFGLVRDAADAPQAARGVWPPRPPAPSDTRPDGVPGPRPPRKEAARPYTYGGDETGDGARDPRACPESVTGHGSAGPDGRCPWCQRKIERKSSAPDRVPPTTQGQEYRRHYDPDWGTDHRDV